MFLWLIILRKGLGVKSNYLLSRNDSFRTGIACLGREVLVKENQVALADSFSNHYKNEAKNRINWPLINLCFLMAFRSHSAVLMFKGLDSSRDCGVRSKLLDLPRIQIETSDFLGSLRSF